MPNLHVEESAVEDLILVDADKQRNSVLKKICQGVTLGKTLIFLSHNKFVELFVYSQQADVKFYVAQLMVNVIYPLPSDKF